MDVTQDVKYLRLLAQSFPTIAAASTEIINLQAILNLPKGTEHFLADIHGEHEAFRHVLKNASGNIRRKVNDLFGNTLRESEQRELCTLIYYPDEKLELVKASEPDIDDWYHITIHYLVAVCRLVSSKYTRSKVRKSLPVDFSYIIQELLHETTDDVNKTDYVNGIIDTIISTGRADSFIIAISNVIQQLSIDQLHILGDIYDRGSGATFAMETYGDDPCTEFMPKVSDESRIDQKTKRLIALMHKAIAILQFKEEGKLYAKHPEWGMADRMLLNSIDYTNGTVCIDGTDYPLRSNNFPTIDPADPYTLTAEEEALMDKLRHSFRVSEKLHKHIRIILQHGCMFAIFNNNLLFHASIPLNDDGTLKEVEIRPGTRRKGRELLYDIGMQIRSAFQEDTPAADRDYAIDYFLYLWCGPNSPLFDKSKMATFERYFVEDKSTHSEEKGNYFKLRVNEDIVDYILDSFGVYGPNRHIINGHVPVHVSSGENPIKANGKLMVIDGGFSSAYHKETGIAGYTLVYHSRGFQLVQHEPFTSAADAIQKCLDIRSTTYIIEMSHHRMRVADTDIGTDLKRQISDLKQLLRAYRHGIISENCGR